LAVDIDHLLAKSTRNWLTPLFEPGLFSEVSFLFRQKAPGEKNTRRGYQCKTSMV
jgi:hypothetical protein